MSSPFTKARPDAPGAKGRANAAFKQANLKGAHRGADRGRPSFAKANLRAVGKGGGRPSSG